MLYSNAIISSNFSLRNLDYPFIIFLKITSYCMLNCQFCSQYPRKNENMCLDFAKKTLYNMKKNGAKTVFYTGGEPLLYPYLSELVEYGHELGMYQVVVTNGVLLNSTKVKNIFKNINSLSISLHGRKNTHDILVCKNKTFDKVSNNIIFVKNNYSNINIDILYTAIPENTNLNDIKYIADFCKENSFDMSISRVNYIGNGEKYYQNYDINKLFKIVNDLVSDGYKADVGNCVASCMVYDKYHYLTRGCDAGVLSCAIETNGDVKICASSQEKLGNLRYQNLKKIWNCKKLKDLRNLKKLSPTCQSCDNFQKCRGGCHSEFNNLGNDLCDGLVIKQYDQIWNLINNKNINLAIADVSSRRGNYMIVGKKIRLIDKLGYKMLNYISRCNSIELITKKFPNSKLFLIALYLDGFITLEDK